MNILSALEGWIGLLLLWNFILSIIVVVFLVAVPRHLADIAHYLRQIFLYGYDLPKDDEED